VMSPRPAVRRRFLPTSPFNKPPAEAVIYEEGDWVSNDKHGLGRVLSFDAGTSDAPATVVVDFRGGNVRRITLPSASLSKLDESPATDEIQDEIQDEADAPAATPATAALPDAEPDGPAAGAQPAS